MRIWKWSCLFLVSCMILTGCGSSSTQKADSGVAAGTPQKQVEMAVPPKGIPVLMLAKIIAVQDKTIFLQRFLTFFAGNKGYPCVICTKNRS